MGRDGSPMEEFGCEPDGPGNWMADDIGLYPLGGLHLRGTFLLRVAASIFEMFCVNDVGARKITRSASEILGCMRWVEVVKEVIVVAVTFA